MQNDPDTQHRNQAIWETAIVAMLTIDSQGNIVAYNPAAEALFGYSYDEVLNRNVDILVPDTHRSSHNDYLQHYLEQNQAGSPLVPHSIAVGHSRELEGLHKAGHTFPIRLSLSEMIIDGQRQFSAIIQDTSELKASEKALRESEQRLRFSQNFAGIGAWDWNVTTDELFWSEQIPPLFGYPEGTLETSYENFISAVHVDDRLLVEDAIIACLERDIPYDIEHRIVWPDGSVHWLHERGDAIRSADGNAVRMLGVVSDITTAKETQVALHKSEARFRDIAESMSDWIWEVDVNGVYTYCAGNVEAILGYRPEEIIGRTPFELMPEAEEKIIAAIFSDIVSQKLPIKNLENWNLTKDGRRVCLLTNGVPLINAEGELIGYRGVDKDITDRKQFEEELIAAKENAEKANLAKSEFLSNMSHELRTPLNAILGFAQLFGLDTNLSEDQKKNLLEINRAGEHLLELINEILDLAKVEAGHLDLNLSATPLTEILEECYAISLPLTKDFSVHLHIAPNTDAAAYTDRTRLKQVLLNLISNAIKYNQPNGMVEVKVGLGAQNHWRITVSDTGRGISPENLQELYKPFNRLGLGQSQIEGSGIGLVICKKFVEAMGGNIGVNSSPGKGSQFWVELPSAEAFDPEVKADEPECHLTNDGCGCENNKTPSEHSGYILAVEDNSTNQVLLHKQLESLHYKVDIASNGIEALDFLSRKSYRLILTDCKMPKLNGFQLTEIIRQQENGQQRHTPIIAVTANIITDEADRFMRAGMDDYLAKPVKLDKLQAIIEKYWANVDENERPLFSTSVEDADNRLHFDITVLRNTLGEQANAHRQVLSIFTQSAPANVEEIMQAVTLQDHDALQAAAHKLKSAARAIGAHLLAAICQLLEVNSHHSDWNKITMLSAQLITAMSQVEIVIADYI
jgi:PAS domain S-box-containing protein